MHHVLIVLFVLIPGNHLDQNKSEIMKVDQALLPSDSDLDILCRAPGTNCDSSFSMALHNESMGLALPTVAFAAEILPVSRHILSEELLFHRNGPAYSQYFHISQEGNLVVEGETHFWVFQEEGRLLHSGKIPDSSSWIIDVLSLPDNRYLVSCLGRDAQQKLRPRSWLFGLGHNNLIGEVDLTPTFSGNHMLPRKVLSLDDKLYCSTYQRTESGRLMSIQQVKLIHDSRIKPIGGAFLSSRYQQLATSDTWMAHLPNDSRFFVLEGTTPEIAVFEKGQSSKISILHLQLEGFQPQTPAQKGAKWYYSVSRNTGLARHGAGFIISYETPNPRHSWYGGDAEDAKPFLMCVQVLDAQGRNLGPVMTRPGEFFVGFRGENFLSMAQNSEGQWELRRYTCDNPRDIR